MKSFTLPSDLDTNFSMVAKTIFGLEELCMNELSKLGAENVTKHNRAVSFEGNIGVLYKSNLLCRMALRILIPIFELEVEDENDLYNQMKEIDWSAFMEKDDTLAIDTVLNTTIFNHSQYISQKSKDAIADYFREKTGVRPSVDLENPTIRLHIHIFQNKCSIALDSSGESLHKRGYREKTNLAPINEVLAAGLVQLTDWDKRSTLVDGMCGSGTILIEAAMLAANIPAAYFREHFGWMNWKKTLPFNEDLWKVIYEKAIEKISSENVQLYGIELSPHVTRKAKENIKRSKTEDMIKVRNADFTDTDAPPTVGKGILILNPPYGERMTKEEDIEALYKSMGDTFKQRYKGYDCWVVSSNLTALKHIGLHATRKITVFNGQLECKFMKFSIYDGSKKLKFQQQQLPE